VIETIKKPKNKQKGDEKDKEDEEDEMVYEFDYE
jgi:hypothetical protein